MSGAATSTASQNTATNKTESGNTASSTLGTTANTGVQNQQSTTETGPWSATSGLLSNIISSLNGMSTATTPAQSEALATLQSGASAVPNFGDAATGVVNNLTSAQPKYSGMLTGALDQYGSGLSPYLSSSYLDPMSTPGLSDALSTMSGDITNKINSQFAAAGRDLSPANSTALARGLTEGMAPVIANQYNQNVATQRGAQDSLYGARGGTASALTGQDQTALGNQAAGVNLAGTASGLYTLPGTTQLNAANTAYSQPYSNVGMLQDLVTQLSQLGQTSTGSATGTTSTAGSTTGSTAGSYSGTGSGTSNTTGSQTKSAIDTFNSLFGGAGGGSVGSFLSLLSDVRAKEDIAPVGMLYDGQPVYSYNYKGDPTPQIGLLAQEVEERTPEAVTEIGGLKHVQYGKATERARQIGGMLDDLPWAA